MFQHPPTWFVDYLIAGLLGQTAEAKPRQVQSSLYLKGHTLFGLFQKLVGKLGCTSNLICCMFISPHSNTICLVSNTICLESRQINGFYYFVLLRTTPGGSSRSRRKRDKKEEVKTDNPQEELILSEVLAKVSGTYTISVTAIPDCSSLNS